MYDIRCTARTDSELEILNRLIEFLHYKLVRPVGNEVVFIDKLSGKARWVSQRRLLRLPDINQRTEVSVSEFIRRYIEYKNQDSLGILGGG